MKINYPQIIVSGLQPKQQFISVQSGTGVVVGSPTVNVTGIRNEVEVIEVREQSASTNTGELHQFDE